MSKVYRVYVEKRKEYAVEAKDILNDIHSQLNIQSVDNVSVINRYDVQGVSEDVLNQGIKTILSEPMVDDVTLEDINVEGKIIAIEYLPGQYDQRADACEQCFQLLTGEKKCKS
jgi:phosphoribosylformylglycinamidine synthase